MKLLSPTVILNESSIRCQIAFPGLLLAAAMGGSILTVLAMRRRFVKAAPGSDGQRTPEDRIREVDGLRELALITDAEQAEARLRILNEI
ncbi:MAG: hypothetical protein QNL68_20840 [Akkermansiaceae bacterium]|jgi:hypothetical protein